MPVNKKNPLKVFIRKFGSLLLDIGAWLHSIAEPSKKIIPRTPSLKRPNEHLALIAGYFSFEDGYATFGDTVSMKKVSAWLDDIALPYDIACHHSNGFNGVDITQIDEKNYSVLIFVCGPWKKNNLDLTERFNHTFKVGVNLSVEDNSADCFDLLYPRDTPEVSYPDLVFSSSKQVKKPTIGVFLVHPQSEYGDRQRHHQVNNSVQEFIDNNADYNFIFLDTLHLNNKSDIRTVNDFEAILSKLDAVISSRLHGLVFSLKNGIPVIAIDPVAGGAKVSKQANAVDWPILIDGDTINLNVINSSIVKALSSEMKQEALNVHTNTLEKMQSLQTNLKNNLTEFMAAPNKN